MLPCGAGKTLVGITIISTVKKPTVILCNSSLAVDQWKNQLKQWSNIDDESIVILTKDNKSKI